MAAVGNYERNEVGESRETAMCWWLSAGLIDGLVKESQEDGRCAFMEDWWVVGSPAAADGEWRGQGVWERTVDPRQGLAMLSTKHEETAKTGAVFDTVVTEPSGTLLMLDALVIF